MTADFLTIAPFARADRACLLESLAQSRWTHTQLDWMSEADWLADDDSSVWLAWQDNALQGWLGMSPPVAGWRWIRMLGVRDGRMPGAVLRELWNQAESDCRESDCAGIAILMLSNWLPSYFAGLGFRYRDDLIMMQHIGRRLPDSIGSTAQLHPAEANDLAEMQAIEAAAFAPPWQIDGADLWRAWRLCAYSSVARVDGRMVGYQLCSRHGAGAHLARLAVHPAAQGRGVASALIRGLLADLRRQGIRQISVNTQARNRRSQRLYERFGFLRNGKDHPLWQKDFGAGA